MAAPLERTTGTQFSLLGEQGEFFSRGPDLGIEPTTFHTIVVVLNH